MSNNKLAFKHKKPLRRTLGLDLGSVNTALSLIVGNKTIKIKHAEMVPPTLRDLKDPVFDSQMKAMRQTIIKMLDKHKPNEVMAERYMNRGIKGVQVEILGLLLGCLATLCINRKIPLRLVTASSWKNSINRQHPGTLDRFYRYFPISKRHRVDAILIGLYCRSKIYDVKHIRIVEKYISKMEGSYGQPKPARAKVIK